MLYRATQYIDELRELDPRYVPVQTMLNDALIQVREATRSSTSCFILSKIRCYYARFGWCNV